MKKDSESVRIYGGDAHEEIGSIQIESILDVGAVGVSPDGKTIALSHGTEISLWDLGTVRDLYGNGRSASLSHASGPLVGHGRRVSHLEFSSPDRGERGLLFSASIDQTIRVWDVASRETRSILRGHTDEVGLMSLSPNGTELASVSREGTIKIWPVRSPGIPRQVILREPADVTFSRDGRRLITADCSADNSGHVRLREWNWDRESLSEIQDEGQLVPFANTTFLLISHHGDMVVAISTDGTVRLWDAGSGQEVDFDGTPGTVSDHTWGKNATPSLSEDGKTLGLSVDAHREIQVWQLLDGRMKLSLTQEPRSMSCFVVSPDGARLAIGHMDFSVTFWDIAKQSQIGTLTHTHEADRVRAVMFSPDGKLLISKGDNTAKLWSVSDEVLLGELKSHLQAVDSVAFTPDSQRIAVSTHDSGIKLWDAETQRELGAIDERVSKIVFSPTADALVGLGYLTEPRKVELRLWRAKPTR